MPNPKKHHIHRFTYDTLQFTEQDRQKVWEKIELQNKTKKSLKKKRCFHYMPAAICALTLLTAIILFIPNVILTNKQFPTQTADKLTPELSSVTGIPEEIHSTPLTVLVAIKSKEMDNRIVLNLLFHSENTSPSVNVLALNPYVNSGDDENVQRLLSSYQNGGAMQVVADIENATSIAIDHYFVIDVEQFTSLFGTQPFLQYESDDALTIHGITQKSETIEQGTTLLTIEKVLALVVEATKTNSIDDTFIAQLLYEWTSYFEQTFSQEEKMNWLTTLQTNYPLDDLLTSMPLINQFHSINIRSYMHTQSKILSATEGEFYYSIPNENKNLIQSLFYFLH